MELRNLIAIGVSLLFFFVYLQYMENKYPEYRKSSQVAQTDQSEANKDIKPEQTQNTNQLSAPEEPSSAGQEIAETAKAPEEAHKQLSADQLRLENAEVSYQFDQGLSALTSIKLKGFKDRPGKNQEQLVELAKHPFFIQASADPKQVSPLVSFQAERIDNETIRFSKQVNGWMMSQTFRMAKQGYNAELNLTFKNVSNKSQQLNAGFFAAENLRLDKDSGGFFPSMVRNYETVMVSLDGSRDEEMISSYCEDEENVPALSGTDELVDFIGFDHHYFLKLLIPSSKKLSFRIAKKGLIDTMGNCSITMAAYQPQGLLKPGETVQLKFATYFGPKKQEALSKVDETLTSALNLGWFSAIARPLLSLVKSIYHFTGNYGVAIVLLTICLKILFYPLTKAAAVSMKRMQKFTPEMNRIREKFKDDRARQQQEIMKFMSQHKINPAKGCLPILPQIPVFIAFYNVLSQSIELRHAPFFGWIHDLSVADPYYITPVIMGVGMFIQQKLTPNPQMDETQKKVMMFMPIMFSFMMISLPAGMVIYMITNTVVSIAQQHWLNKSLDAKMQTEAKKA